MIIEGLALFWGISNLIYAYKSHQEAKKIEEVAEHLLKVYPVDRVTISKEAREAAGEVDE